ncbi:MAG: C25 family cysteine peptidase [Ilumatobacter sp.]
MSAPRVAIVATADRRRAIAPLLAAYHRRYRVNTWSFGSRGVPTVAELAHLATDAEAILVIGPRRRSPRTVLPGPVVTATDGRVVPVGWVPDVGADGLARFAERAAAVHARAESCHERTTAILGSRLDRYEDLARRIERLLSADHADAAHRWTASEQMMEDAIDGLGSGPAAVCYVGHGRPVGWAGYRGVRAEHLEQLDQPSALVMSFTCRTASRRRVGISFAEQLVVQGSTAACLGAVVATDHQWNGRWAYRMCRSLDAARTVGELVVAARPELGQSPYRLIGDPLAPLLDAPGARDAMTAHTRRHRDLATRALIPGPRPHPNERPQERIA